MKPSPNTTADAFTPFHIVRPAKRLLTYYFLVSLLTGPLFPFVLVPLFFKYETLRFRFDESGVAMSWGILFRREVYLTYRRIQDIHLSRNIVQRWMNLATVGVQTASGSATPEMSIEGILEADELRDFFYTRMRGAHGNDVAGADTHGSTTDSDEALQLLHEIRDLLQRKLREEETR